jgi:hypothetical protein
MKGVLQVYINVSFNGDIHWFFLLQTSKSAIHRFCLPMPFHFRKHKGHIARENIPQYKSNNPTVSERVC